MTKILVVAAIWWAVAPVAISQQTNVCEIPKSEKPQVVIDANTGFILEGRDTYARNSQLRVVVAYKNPFKYEYEYSVNVEPLDSSPAIRGFLALVAPLGAVPDLWSVPDQVEAENSMKIVPYPSSAPLGFQEEEICGGYEHLLLNGLERDLNGHSELAKRLALDLATVKPKYDAAQKSYADFYALTSTDRIDCEGVMADAMSTVSELKRLSLDNLPGATKKNAEGIARTVEIVSYQKPQQRACKAKRALLLEEGNKMRRQAEAAAELAAKMATGKKSFDALVKLIGQVTAMDPFHEVHTIGGYREPSQANITVTRKSRRDADAEATKAKVSIQLGHRFFALSIGLGLSSITEKEFGQVDSLVPDGSGGMVVGKRFAVVNDSDPTPLGAVVLNTNLWKWSSKSEAVGGLSTGVSIGNGDTAQTFGYLFGVSAGLLQQKFYITAAYHLRRVDRLAGGFAPGDVVPMGITETPLTRTTENGFMVVFSYNTLQTKVK